MNSTSQEPNTVELPTSPEATAELINDQLRKLIGRKDLVEPEDNPQTHE